MENLLLKLGFEKVRQKKAMSFTDISTGGQPQFLIIQEEN